MSYNLMHRGNQKGNKMSFLKISSGDASSGLSWIDLTESDSTDSTKTEKLSESCYDSEDKISISQPRVGKAGSSDSHCLRQSMSDSLGGYDVDDRISISQPTVGKASSSYSRCSRQSMSNSLGGYDADEKTSYPLHNERLIPKSHACLTSCRINDCSEKAESPSRAVLLTDNVLRMEGAKGYAALDPVMNAFKRKEALSSLKDTNYEKIVQVFYRHSTRALTDSWAVEVLDLLTTHFGYLSIQPFGKGSNSGVFIMEQNESEEKKVLRLFPIYGFNNPDQSKAYRLNKNRIGGEWLSIVVEHPNVAANSHILVWDQLEGFKIMDRDQAQLLMDCYDQLEDGREFYAIGTLGNFTEGSVDLEQLKDQKFSKDQIREILKGLCEGVAAFHDNGICHRDIKLSNVIMLPSGKVQLIDFGSSTQEGKSLRMSRGGDFAYHPVENIKPSQIRSGKKADSYGLFRIAYHLVSGKDYFEEVHQVRPAQMRLMALTDAHEALLEKEQRFGFSQILQEDPSLTDSEPELIEVMSALGTGISSNRILPKDAMQMNYFRP
ncbi:MAG: protein kinase family protein [Verrucomicrobia bacterium]|nr:protein kinase family protein [Verrucomicrobiota bacterium]